MIRSGWTGPVALLPESKLSRPIRDASELSHPALAGLRASEAEPETRMRILVVDDEPAVAAALADALRGQGHLAVVALSGVEGLAAIDREMPDAVFLDLVMPDLSGLDVLKEIRRRHSSLPIVIVTGYAGSATLDEIQQLGVTDIVEKPWALKHLGEALANLRPD
jgi:CheY-like chemotaxis protein